MTWGLVIFGTAWNARPLLADVAPSPLAAASQPKIVKGKAKAIRMAREEVEIRLHPSFAIVDATFVMVNEGKDAELEVGFPGRGVIQGTGWSQHTALIGFSAWSGDLPLKVAEKELEVSFPRGPEIGGRAKRQENWHVFSAVFKSRKETILRVQYGVVASVAYTEEGYGETPPPLDSIWYILHTGSMWKGPIGSGVVRVVAADGVDALSIQAVNHAPRGLANKEKWSSYKLPEGARRTADGFEWTFKALEPRAADNLEIVYRSDPARRVLGERNDVDAERIVPLILKALGRPEPKK